MRTESTDILVISDVKTKLSDIIIDVSWKEIANRYFGKSSSWLYHKLDGIKDDGEKDAGFTPKEAEQLKSALYDLADRIRAAADNI